MTEAEQIKSTFVAKVTFFLEEIDRPVTYAEVKKEVDIQGYYSVRKIIERLVGKGYVKRTGPGFFRFNRKWRGKTSYHMRLKYC